jgi:plasmid stabilization system protein ParE
MNVGYHHAVQRDVNRVLRRANLKRFPYHFLYRILPDRIRITAVRHHRQNPRFGLQRR